MPNPDIEARWQKEVERRMASRRDCPDCGKPQRIHPYLISEIWWHLNPEDEAECSELRNK